MSQKIRIVVLGGGYGGVHATKHIYKKYKKNKNVEITLIDKNPYHTLMTELHEVAGARVDPESVQVSFRKIFGGKRVRVVTDTIKRVDFEGKKLYSEVDEFEYDYLVMGVGGEPEFFDIPGVQENSFSLWSLEDALRIREHIDSMFLEASKEADPEIRKKHLTFAVAGAGFTGIEMAGEILERKKTLCLYHGLDESEVRVVIIEAMGNILPILSDKLKKKAQKYLEKKGAEIMLSSPIVGAEEGVITIEGDKEIHANTFIWTCGIQGAAFTAKVDLTKGKSSKSECSYASPEGVHGMRGCHFEEEERYIVGERGRILVDDTMRSVDHDNVYLVGDCVWFVENEKVLPQIVETALQTAEVAAENLCKDIEGEKEKTPFKSNYHGFMVSIGSKYAVSNAGGMKTSGFFALALKHLINIHYLFGLAGVNAVWGYLQHEFFTNTEGRSILGSHLAAKIPVYWVLPLRLFLGVKWMIEGINKVTEGWLNPGQGGILNPSAGSIHLPGVSFGDAYSAASPAAENGGEAAADAGSAATAAADAASSASPAAEGAASTTPEPLMEAIAPYTWFAETVLSSSETLAFLLQAVVVIAEIAIGLALIGGCFTFLAAGASILLGIMFIFSGWGNPELLWYLFAAIVMLGGAGKGFGLDHWVMPWLKDRWNGTTLAKRSYLYVDEPRD